MIVYRVVAYDNANSMGDNIMAEITDPLDQSIIDAAAEAAFAYLPQSARKPVDISAYSGVRVVRTEEVSVETADYPVEV